MELLEVERDIAVKAGRVELHRADHVGPRVVVGLEVVHGGVEVELALHGVGGEGMGHLAGGVLVLLGEVGQHATKERDIQGLAAIQYTAQGFFDLVGHSISTSPLYISSRPPGSFLCLGSFQGLPVLVY